MQDAKAIVRRFLLDTIVMAGDVEIGDETSFMDEHILDSTGFIELITFVEETFSVTVDDEEMLPENFDSLRNIDDYLARKRAARAVA
jgi:acyl carrier protein